MIINEARARELGNLFRSVGLQGVMAFEDEDPQMRSAKTIEARCPGTAATALYINALVSYMLPMKGERYWSLFAEHITRSCPRGWERLIESVKRFTRSVHRFGVRQKLNRLEVMRGCGRLENLIRVGDYVGLWHETAGCLRTQRDKKTIVFSVKMAYYGRRAAGHRETLPMKIPMPVDRRVARASILSGVIEGAGSVKDLMRRHRIVAKAWGIVADISGVPPLHLDSVLWVITSYWGLPSPHEVLRSLPQGLVGKAGEDLLLIIIEELLFYRRCIRQN